MSNQTGEKLNRPQSDWASFMIVEAEYQSLKVVLTDADYIWQGQFIFIIIYLFL